MHVTETTREPMRSEPAPEIRDGVAGWRVELSGATALFLGKGLPRERDAALPESWLPSSIRRARLKQVHGAAVLDGESAGGGICGEGDGLVTRVHSLALEIATADCVPVLLAGEDRLGAAHAGWRGIAAGVVSATVERLGGAESLVAWIGPAIGPCCYEVGEDVAEAVTAALPGVNGIASRVEGQRPRLDLSHAVAEQLHRAGVRRIETLAICTRCNPDWLWSYRRDGAGAGRNLALVYLK